MHHFSLPLVKETCQLIMTSFLFIAVYVLKVYEAINNSVQVEGIHLQYKLACPVQKCKLKLRNYFFFFLVRFQNTKFTWRQHSNHREGMSPTHNMFSIWLLYLIDLHPIINFSKIFNSIFSKILMYVVCTWLSIFFEIKILKTESLNFYKMVRNYQSWTWPKPLL